MCRSLPGRPRRVDTCIVQILHGAWYRRCAPGALIPCSVGVSSSGCLRCSLAEACNWLFASNTLPEARRFADEPCALLMGSSRCSAARGSDTCMQMLATAILIIRTSTCGSQLQSVPKQFWLCPDANMSADECNHSGGHPLSASRVLCQVNDSRPSTWAGLLLRFHGLYAMFCMVALVCSWWATGLPDFGPERCHYLDALWYGISLE